MGNFIIGLIYLGQWHGGLLVYIKIGVHLFGCDHIVTLPTMGLCSTFGNVWMPWQLNVNVCHFTKFGPTSSKSYWV
jgi:hypothetical protein